MTLLVVCQIRHQMHKSMTQDVFSVVWYYGILLSEGCAVVTGPFSS